MSQGRGGLGWARASGGPRAGQRGPQRTAAPEAWEDSLRQIHSAISDMETSTHSAHLLTSSVHSHLPDADAPPIPPPPVPPKAPAKCPPPLPSKPELSGLSLNLSPAPYQAPPLPSSSPPKDSPGSPNVSPSGGGEKSVRFESGATEARSSFFGGMSPVRKTLTEISNSASFASEASGRGPVKMGLRSRSPSPSRKALAGDWDVRELQGYVGFANIPNQVYRRAVKKGFHLNMMVVGASGLGKSTFINSLFLAEVHPPPSQAPQPIPQTTKVEPLEFTLRENGVGLDLTIVDTPGFGDQVDNTKCWQPIIDYVDRRYAEYFAEETKVERAAVAADRRVQVCLYFLAPSGHGLKPLDVEFMKQLSERVNVVPVIAKADAFTPEELAAFKARILADIATHGIRVYKFPEAEAGAEGGKEAGLLGRVPFAVVGSNSLGEVGGKRVRCRRYPWGVVEVENLQHNDFIALRNLLVRTHLVDLIEVTKGVHYENFRCRQLMSPGAKTPTGGGQDPFTAMARERKDHAAKLASKEADMERVFKAKVGEKEASQERLEREKEAELAQRTKALHALHAESQAKRDAINDIRKAHPGLKPFSPSSSTLTRQASDTKKAKGVKGFFS